MRWLRFEFNGVTSFGIVEGENIRPVLGNPFGDYKVSKDTIAFSVVRHLPPVVPPTFYAAGMNYANHVQEASEYFHGALKLPTKADVGYRAPNALVGSGHPIIIPSDSPGPVQYEAELVAVIGKKVKNVREDEALDCVFGYTIGNDVSERTWQGEDRTLWRSKNTDTFKPMGPWIETDVDLPSLVTRVWIDDVLKTEFQTNNMIHGVAHYISEMSKYLTLYPGDIIWMGTEAPSQDMHDGETIKIEIDGIGVLCNPIERAR
jgi:2-keto-4-pentenoate hydratase/2-oxohepta-3-ene-1,7-dioic acid hydratase in catechol pathway